ncbi:HNH endonuclease family protein [Mycoplasma sp. VS509_3]|uniref:HNH endonuclease family protein n=1 Tax=unclassified Mycoplasma TaxID=2683645 RepID=UPI003AAFDABD
MNQDIIKMSIEEVVAKVNDGKIISDISIQREIVYDANKQALVIDSIVNDIPLPAFYFWENENGVYEVLDGKQRIEAIKNFKHNDIQYNNKNWKEYGIYNPDLQNKVNNTLLNIIVCRGDEEHKRNIFYRINTLGVPLSDFEIVNGLYNGVFINTLKQVCNDDKNLRKVFKESNKASRGTKEYWVLSKIVEKKDLSKILDYVKENKDSVTKLEDDYNDKLSPVIDIMVTMLNSPANDKDIWFEIFSKALKKNKQCKSILKDNKPVLNDKIAYYDAYLKKSNLIDKREYYENIINGYLENINLDKNRLFSDAIKRELFDESQKELMGNKEAVKCNNCKKYFYYEDLQVDHIYPWSKGGSTTKDNAQLLCGSCNAKKSNK